MEHETGTHPCLIFHIIVHASDGLRILIHRYDPLVSLPLYILAAVGCLRSFSSRLKFSSSPVPDGGLHSSRTCRAYGSAKECARPGEGEAKRRW